MILDYDNVLISQEDIVKRSYGMDTWGNLPNFGGTVEVITANLNNWDVDRHGEPYKVKAKFCNYRPSENTIIELITKKQAILISYKSGPTTNHAVVITSCRYSNTSNISTIKNITVRDPWLSEENKKNNGIVTYEFSKFYQLINYYWVVNVEKDADVYVNIDKLKNCSDIFCNKLKDVIAGFDNDFLDLKGENFEGTDRIYHSIIKFPDEKSNLIYSGVFPIYTVRFYSGDSLEMANFIFENLKNKFSFLNDALEESILIPEGFITETKKSRIVNVHLDHNLVLC